MARQPQHVRLRRFGVFEVDLQARELRKGGLKIKIHDQPFQVLTMLLERPGEIVTREELHQRLWTADTFVDFDHGLNTAVNKLREVLGDSAESPRFIETAPRRGYRFLGPFESFSDGAARQEIATRPAIVITSPEPKGRWRWLLLAFVVLSLGIVGTWSYWLKQESRKVPAPKTVPLVSYLGDACCPTFSPDGNQVAFVWDGPKQDNHDIYVKLIGEENAVRLTSDPAQDYSPAWSPDGRSIAFLRVLSGGKTGVFLVPAISGPDRKVAELAEVFWFSLSWFPDGKWLAVPDRNSIYLLSVQTGENRRLTLPAAGNYDGTPSFSPDGRYLAFSRSDGYSEIYLLALSNNLAPKGEPKQITFQHQWSGSPAWTANGREIIYSSGQGLWRMPVSGGESPQPMFTSVQSSTPAISRQGNRLAYTRGFMDNNIWRLEVPPLNGRARQPIKLISSTYDETAPQYSPDGKRIAFASARSGSTEIWVCSSDGSNAVQLTSLGATVSGSPHWSPDGQKIVFDSTVEGQFELYLIDANGGRPRRLTNHPANDAVATFSRDGHSIYFGSDRTRDWQIWKMPADGGEPTQVTRTVGHNALESVDGKFVYFSKFIWPTASVWRVPVSGGKETRVLEPALGQAFGVARKGIYFVVPGRDGNENRIQFLNFATGKVRTIATIHRPLDWGLSVSPDEQYVLYTQVDQMGGDLVLVENFR